MTRAIADALRAQLDETAHAPEVKVLVITGTGAAFSSGVDRAEAFAGPDATLHARRTTPLWPVDELFAYPKPIIAALNGPAHGGGATLAMACDLRVAAATASLTFNLGTVGLTPEFGSSYLLWRQVGYATALELMLTGETLDAETARQRGLVNQVVDDDALVDTVQALAERLASLPSGTAEAIKAVLKGGLDATFAEARTNELRSLAERARAIAARADRTANPEGPA